MTSSTPSDSSGPLLARLLVLCARPGIPARDLPAVREILRHDLPWERLMAKADEEGVLPLLYWSLKGLPEDVPPAVLERLRARYLGNLRRNLQLGRQVSTFLAAAREAGLNVVLTKGLRLAATVYPDVGLRPFWDVDLVASAADWPGLRRVLDAQGFVETPAADPGRDTPVSSYDWVYSPYFRRGDLVLEFHFNVLGLHYPARPEADAGPSSIALETGDTEAAVFSPEHELCYLCLHAQQHSYRKLIWLTDIAQMAARSKISWDTVAAISSTYRVLGPVFYGLELVERLWPGTIPAQVGPRFRPGILTRTALGVLWPAPAVAGREVQAWPYYMPSLFSLWERGSARLALRSLGAILFPPRRWLAQAVGVTVDSPRLYLEYARRLMRPFGLAVRRLGNIR
jgi:hypothetical protein